MWSYNDPSRASMYDLELAEKLLMIEIQSKNSGEATKKAARKNLSKVLKEIKKRQKQAKGKDVK